MTLPKIKTFSIIFLVILLAGSAYLLREEIKNGARLALGIERLEQQMDRQQEVISDLLERQEYISEQNTILRNNLKDIQEKANDTNSLLLELGEEDEEYMDWSDDDLPESIVERLLKQRQDGSED